MHVWFCLPLQQNPLRKHLIKPMSDVCAFLTLLTVYVCRVVCLEMEVEEEWRVCWGALEEQLQE